MRRRKLWIAGGLILSGGMLMRFAWATIEDPISVVLIIAGAILFLGGAFLFVLHFRE
ncbi:MAG TPA: hypothetical protein VGE26_08280 [Sphingobacteriaceae bacterium]